ncbi:MAG: CotH kinase family protein [Deltaproteobacteria bacterium]|nr:CotH kinase family protein [Deltaproteobacteria bacterium]
MSAVRVLAVAWCACALAGCPGKRAQPEATDVPATGPGAADSPGEPDGGPEAGPDGGPDGAPGPGTPTAANPACFRGGMGEERLVVATFDADGNGRLNADERARARKFLQDEAAACPQGMMGGGPGGFPPGMGPGGPFPDGGFPPGMEPRGPFPDGGFPPGMGPRGPFPDGGFPPGMGPRGPRGDGGRPFGGGPGGPMHQQRDPAKPGIRIAPSEVESYADKGLYDPTVFRTLFLDFEEDDWEAELNDFHGTDVDVAAKLTVDGQAYEGVGVHFRGNSSYFMAGDGYKKSMRVSVDFEDDDRRLGGYKSLILLNANEDPSFLRAVLYLDIARRYFPAPKANFVRVVINGESWGVFVNQQAFDKPFLGEWFADTGGTRWQVPVNFQGGAALTYVGADRAPYEAAYERKNGGGSAAWEALIELCRVLAQTPTDELEAALRPLLDVDGVLWFLALDNVAINGDGYWVRASDYALFRDADKVFHVVPHDVNETFKPAGGGPGMGHGSAAQGLELDPLFGADDDGKPLLHRLLAVPRLREEYLRRVRTIAELWLDDNVLGPTVEAYRALIRDAVEADTRKLYSFEAFLGEETVTDGDTEAGEPVSEIIGIREFAERRRAFLLAHEALAGLAAYPPPTP